MGIRIKDERRRKKEVKMYDGRKCGYIREGERRKNGRSRCMREREGREGWREGGERGRGERGGKGSRPLRV